MASLEIVFFIVTTLITKELFKQLLICAAVENEASWILQFSEDNWGMRCYLMWYAWVTLIIILTNK